MRFSANAAFAISLSSRRSSDDVGRRATAQSRAPPLPPPPPAFLLPSLSLAWSPPAGSAYSPRLSVSSKCLLSMTLLSFPSLPVLPLSIDHYIRLEKTGKFLQPYHGGTLLISTASGRSQYHAMQAIARCAEMPLAHENAHTCRRGHHYFSRVSGAPPPYAGRFLRPTCHAGILASPDATGALQPISANTAMPPVLPITTSRRIAT